MAGTMSVVENNTLRASGPIVASAVLPLLIY